ncbi:hypothetical protein AAC387_Pa08g0182 [Persea americana]
MQQEAVLDLESIQGKIGCWYHGTQDSKGVLKGMDWKALSDVPNASGMPFIKKRLPGKMRQIPDDKRR